MNGIEKLLDTNAILYYLDGNEKARISIEESPVLVYSTITRIELLSYQSLTMEQEQNILGFLDTCSEIEINPSIRDAAIFLRKKYRLKIPDAVIAAIALVNKIPLLTFDSDFKKISEIETPLLA